MPVQLPQAYLPVKSLQQFLVHFVRTCEIPAAAKSTADCVLYSICAPDLFLTNPHPFPFPEGPDRPMDQLDAPRQHPHFSFTPLRHIAFRQFGFLVNPSQPLFFFLFFYSIVFLRLSSRTGEKPSSEYIS